MKRMKSSLAITLVAGVALIATTALGIYWRESSLPRRLRAEATTKMLQFCTNSVTGFTRIITNTIVEASLVKNEWVAVDLGDNPNLWEGVACVEHLNDKGGIERTFFGVVFPYVKTNGHYTLDCILDVREELAKRGRERRESKAEMDTLASHRRRNSSLIRRISEGIDWPLTD